MSHKRYVLVPFTGPIVCNPLITLFRGASGPTLSVLFFPISWVISWPYPGLHEIIPSWFQATTDEALYRVRGGGFGHGLSNSDRAHGSRSTCGGHDDCDIDQGELDLTAKFRASKNDRDRDCKFIVVTGESVALSFTLWLAVVTPTACRTLRFSVLREEGRYHVRRRMFGVWRMA